MLSYATARDRSNLTTTWATISLRGSPTGALLLVSDQPMVAGGVKTEKSDSAVTTNFVDSHIQIGIDSLNELINNGNTVKHLRFD